VVEHSLEPPQYRIRLGTGRAFRTLIKELLNTVSLVEQSILNISYLGKKKWGIRNLLEINANILHRLGYVNLGV